MPGQLGALRLISLIDQLGAIHSKSSHTNLAQVLLAVLSVCTGKGVITCHSKHFGSAQSSSPHTDLESRLHVELACILLPFYSSNWAHRTPMHKRTASAISAHYRVLCPLAQRENLPRYVSILILENQRLCNQNLDLLTGKGLERQCLHDDFSVQCS